MMKCVVIYNPNSGKLTNRNDIKKLYKIFENYGYDVEIIYTEYKGHAKEITKKLKDVDLLICAGGDGTLNEVISGNIERNKPMLLGHLPSALYLFYVRLPLYHFRQLLQKRRCSFSFASSKNLIVIV